MDRLTHKTSCWIFRAFISWLTFLCACDLNSAEPQRLFTVAADPNNLPFSNAREEGFENKLARIVAHDLNAKLVYLWQPQRRGFLRDTLGSARCHAVMGVPAEIGQCLTSRPYFRSSYVFVFPSNRQQPIDSLDNAQLRNLRIGVQLMGDGQMSPPANALIERGLSNNLVGFSVYSDDRAENPPSEIIRAVADKKIDVAVAWGPVAGYFAARQPVGLTVNPIPQPTDATVPYAFDICVAIRKDEPNLRDEVNAILRKRRTEIAKLLAEFGVPSASALSDKSSKAGILR